MANEHQANNTPEAAVDYAIAALPESSELRQFFEANRSEVKERYLAEYYEAEYMKLIEIEMQREIEEARAETQEADARAVTLALRLLREGATTVKELTDQGVPEKIAQAFIDGKPLSDEENRLSNKTVRTT